MESAQGKELNEPFGRQPRPVKITIEGEDLADVDYWLHYLVRSSEFKGDMATPHKGTVMPDGRYQIAFTIHPRAVND